MKKIAIVGSHGVGKTSLCHHIMQHYTHQMNVVLNCNLARSLISKGYLLNKEATSESYIQYIIAQLTAEQSLDTCDMFISDRTLLDPLAYETVNSIYEGSLVPQSIRDLLFRVWFLEKDQYDLFIFVPAEFPMPLDQIRPQDEQYRLRVEQQLKRYLDEHKVKYLCVTGSLIQRSKTACAAIDKLFETV